ncbi:uncharacterized protein LOC133842578 [Drosophila sulfurigaster albostrigata]|uniref:uncharacterized protein LOC133842578 n=1 Tax=Drosophila sulfurigaster albostrigata TaxID=89887 RepID=UPI002D21CB6E|nr:uncharacterized protein LOC133842578 [Drosophila sulfurigaster albostrigata]
MYEYKQYSDDTNALSRVQPPVMPEQGRAGQYTNKLHYLRKYLLDELVTKKFAMDFMEPVDAVALQVPNYYQVITRPMDVGTIIKRVHNRYYHCVDDLVHDFRLVISNCYTFNRPGDVVYCNCQKLEKFFHRVLNKMPRGEEKPSTKDPRGSGSEKNNEAVQRQCRELLRKLQISISNEDDRSIHKYFNNKLEILSLRLDQCAIRTVEEFRFEINEIFQDFHVQVETFYEFYHSICEHPSLPTYDRCNLFRHHQDFDPPVMDSEDITQLLFTLKRAESSVEQCQKSYSEEEERRARDLLQAFYSTAFSIKQKLCNDGMEKEEEAEAEAEEEKGNDEDEGKEEINPKDKQLGENEENCEEEQDDENEVNDQANESQSIEKINEN